MFIFLLLESFQIFSAVFKIQYIVTVMFNSSLFFWTLHFHLTDWNLYSDQLSTIFTTPWRTAGTLRDNRHPNGQQTDIPQTADILPHFWSACSSSLLPWVQVFDFWFLDYMCREHHTCFLVFVRLHLANVVQVRLCCHRWQDFHSVVLNSIPLCTCTEFSLPIHPLMGSLTQCVAVVNYTAVGTEHRCLFVPRFTPFVFIPKSGIARSYGSYIFNSSRFLYTLLYYSNLQVCTAIPFLNIISSSCYIGYEKYLLPCVCGFQLT